MGWNSFNVIVQGLQAQQEEATKSEWLPRLGVIPASGG